MTTPDRLALRREADKSLTLLGAITDESKSEVTVVGADGRSEVHPAKGLVKVSRGSFNHFSLLHRETLKEAFEASSRAVIEQVLVDASDAGMTASALKSKLTQAGLASADVDKAWPKAKKALEASSDVKISGTGSATKYIWKGEQGSRLRAFLPTQLPVPHEEPVEGVICNQVPTHDVAESVTAEAAHVATPAAPSEADEVPGEPLAPEGLLGVLKDLLAEAAPTSVDGVRRSVLSVGGALTSMSDKKVRALADVPANERGLVALLLLARERPLDLWPEDRELSVSVASDALVSAVGEASRSTDERAMLARFALRVLSRTDLAEIPLPLVASVFVRASSAENGIEPRGHFLELAGLLADRVRRSVAKEWVDADGIVPDIARAMNRLPLDADGPRTRFLAALHEIRRKHLDGDLLWKDATLDDLHLAAGGALRRALADEDLDRCIVRPAVLSFAAECATRHGLGMLMTLRGSFARHLEATTITTVMERVARQDKIAQDWFNGLRQQDAVDAARKAEADAVRASLEAKQATESALERLEKLTAERDSAKAALNRASQESASATDAQLRQSRLDVLKSLASLAGTIKESAAAKEDPALLQRVAFALRREGLHAIAESGDTVSYDPALHDAQGKHIEPGHQVSVGRPGYTYESADEVIVLVKAHVNEH